MSKSNIPAPRSTFTFTARLYPDGPIETFTYSTEKFNLVQFQELFYDDSYKQNHLTSGMLWWYIMRAYGISDYSYQDLINLEQKHSGIIASWIYYIFKKISENNTPSCLCDDYYNELRKLIKSATKKVGSVSSSDTFVVQTYIAEQLYKRFLMASKSSKKLHSYSHNPVDIVNRVLKNIWISNTNWITFGNNNKYPDKEFCLYDEGLAAFVQQCVPNKCFREYSSRFNNLLSEYTIAHILHDNGFNHLLVPLASDCCNNAAFRLGLMYPDNMIKWKSNKKPIEEYIQKLDEDIEKGLSLITSANTTPPRIAHQHHSGIMTDDFLPSVPE